MSHRTLLMAALGLIAAGLLLSGIGVVLGGGDGGNLPGQFEGPNGQEGQQGDFRSGPPHFGPGPPGTGHRRPIPAPAATPQPSPSPTA